MFWARQRELGQGQDDYPVSIFQFHEPYFFNSATAGGLPVRQSMFSQCMTAGEKQRMRYIPFSEGSRTLKNKYTCKPTIKVRVFTCLWSFHEGTFPKQGRVQQSGPSQEPSVLPSKAKLGVQEK